MFNNKKAMELTVTVLVTLSLGLAMMIGLFFFFSSGAESLQDISTQVDDVTKAQLVDRMTQTNAKVITPFVFKEMREGQIELFPLGIRNVFKEDKTFTVLVSKDDENTAKWTFEQQEILVPAESQEVIGIPIQAIEEGTHEFSIQVQCQAETQSLCQPYGREQIITIKVR